MHTLQASTDPLWETPTYLESSDSFRIIPISLTHHPPSNSMPACFWSPPMNWNSNHPFTFTQRLRQLLLTLAASESPIRKTQHSGRISLQWYTKLKTNSHNYSPTQLLGSLFLLSFFSFPSFLWTPDFSNLILMQMHHNEEQWNAEQTKQQNKPSV